MKDKTFGILGVVIQGIAILFLWIIYSSGAVSPWPLLFILHGVLFIFSLAFVLVGKNG